MKEFDVLWAGEYLSVISPHQTPYEAIFESDGVHILPVDVQTAELFVRLEACPPYQVRDLQNRDRFYTVVSGGVEENETPEQAVHREVLEELGINLETAEYELVKLTPERIPFAKNTVSRITLFALMLFDYTIQIPEGDGTMYESLSTFERIPLQQVDDLLITDQADYLLQAAVAKLKCMILVDN